MGLVFEDSNSPEVSNLKRAAKMKSVCLILLALALYCNAAATREKREAGCACDGTKIETNRADGLILGECLHADADGHYCYVSDIACKSEGAKGETARFTNKWVSYELCDCKNAADCNEQIIKFDK